MGAGARPLREQAQPQVLRRICILIFVDEDVFELAVIFFQNIRIRPEDTDRMAEQIAEIASVQRRQPVLIGLKELAALAVGEGAGVALRNFCRAQALVLPVVDHHGELARRPAFVVQALGLDELLDQPHDVVGVEDGEVALQAGKLGMTPQQLDADRVEGAEPRHAFDRLADKDAYAALHFARGLVGEGDGENLRREGQPKAEDMGDAAGEHACLAGSRTGQNKHWSFGRFDGEPLLRIEAFQIAWHGTLTGGHGTRRDAGGRASRTCGRASGRCVPVEEGHVVRKTWHQTRNVVIRAGKARKVTCSPTGGGSSRPEKARSATRS